MADSLPLPGVVIENERMEGEADTLPLALSLDESAAEEVEVPLGELE